MHGCRLLQLHRLGEVKLSKNEVIIKSTTLRNAVDNTPPASADVDSDKEVQGPSGVGDWSPLVSTWAGARRGCHGAYFHPSELRSKRYHNTILAILLTSK